MQKRWKIKPEPDPEEIRKFSEIISAPEIVAKILWQRNINTFEKAKAFFNPDLSNLYDPFLMKDMNLAVNRIIEALNNNENILVYGDYDVDGTTAVALMYSFLKDIYPNVSFYIPDRYNEGYGISYQGIDFARDNNIDLIISLDCGIKANPQVDYAKDLQIDFIICDHHRPSETLPNAVAVLDPQRDDCNYPFSYLSGCGVGFKLIQALCLELNIEMNAAFQYLDLVAVSIAADIVPIIDENRILAAKGIEKLKNNPRTGLKVMLPDQVENINISTIVFGIAPKINAAGRINHASESVELLISDSEPNARKIIYSINELNLQRKDLDSNITEEALNQIENTLQQNNSTSIVYNENWHKGVIGIVASRLIEKHYKPTLVFTKGGENELVASARSVKNFDIYKAIEECSDLLDKYGGHMYAAGLTIKENNFLAFKNKFEEVVKNTISQAQKTPEIEIDCVTTLNELTEKVFRIISRMQPYGPMNMSPEFLVQNVLYGGTHKIIGKGENHLQFTVFEPSSKKIMNVTAFNWASEIKNIKNKPFDLVFTLDENYWQGKVYYKLMAKDIKFKNED